MSVRRQIIAALSAGSVSGLVTLYDVDHATRLVDAHAAEVLGETRSEALHEAAAEAESLIRLFPQDTDWGAAIAGALEGLAFRLRRKAGEKATPAGATATPTDTNRRARLLNEMAYDGGRWKSGDVVAWYKTQGLTELGANTARRDLAALRDSGAITQHDEKGVRFYTRTTAKGGTR